MTLDEAIKHCEEVASDAEKGHRYHAERGCHKDLWWINLYKNRAEEHRQLAEWLKELKRYREHRMEDY